MSIDFARPTSVPTLAVAATAEEAASKRTMTAQLSQLVGNSDASAHFDEISRKLSAGPLTLEYLVAYSIEAYSRR